MYKIGKVAAYCAPLIFSIMPLMASEWVEGVVNQVSTYTSATTASLQSHNTPPLESIEFCPWDEAPLRDDRISTHPAPKTRQSGHNKHCSSNHDLPLMEASLRKNGIYLYPNFNAFTSEEIKAFPPNNAGAAGPTQYLAAVNGGIRSFDKATGASDGAIDMNLDTFFALVSDGYDVKDPHVRYDRTTGRWYILGHTSAHLDGFIPRILIAVSDSDTLSQGTVWSFFYFIPSELTPQRNLTGLFEDFPTLGLDDNALYIGLNIFRREGGGLENTDGFVVRKSSLLGAGPLVVTPFRNLIDESGNGPITPQGVDNFDSNPSYGYFIGVDKSYFGRLILRTIRNAATTPEIAPNAPLNVDATVYPLYVDHLGNKMGMRGYLDPIDDRLANAHVRQGKLYAVHNIGVNNEGISTYKKPSTRTGCRWYQIDINQTNSPRLIQSGTVYGSSEENNPHHKNFLIPSIMTNGPESIVVAASTAGKRRYINATFAIHHAADIEGLMRGPYYYTNTQTAYNPPEDPGSMRGRRWGDYSTTTIDPSDNMTFWAIQQFCNQENSYAVRVARIPAAPPAKLVTCSPSTVAAGQVGLLLHLKGEQVKGSAFYDPGVGYPNHLNVAIDDVLVTTTTWIDATHVDVTISTVGSTPGTKRITITNPDGQYVYGDGLLTVQ